ncbi:MAG: hypothetical protein FWB78_01165 [Treponema sp.]|nr:hypothetical protein [Treponema sp.]
MKNKNLRPIIYVLSCMAFLFSCLTGGVYRQTDGVYPLVIPFYFEHEGYGHIMLYATINGQTGRFMFDTGSMTSWARINGEGLPVIMRFPERIDGRLQYTNFYRVNYIQFGDINVRARSGLVTESDLVFSTLFRPEEYGLLGLGIFEGFWVELSFSRHEIVLHLQKPAHFASASHAPLVMLCRMDPLYLPINIDGREWLMGVDTGLRSAFFFPNDIPNYASPENIIERILSSGEIGDYYLLRANSVTALDRTYYGRFIMNNSYSAARRDWLSHTDKGLVGLRFLRNYDLLFDYREVFYGRTTGMYFMPIVPPEERDYGISFVTEIPVPGIISYIFSARGGLIITDILTGSLAYTLGLRPGAEISKIDGKPISAFTLDELRSRLPIQNAATMYILNEHGDEVLVRFR